MRGARGPVVDGCYLAESSRSRIVEVDCEGRRERVLKESLSVWSLYRKRCKVLAMWKEVDVLSGGCVVRAKAAQEERLI
jgi:hypothetical protein